MFEEAELEGEVKRREFFFFFSFCFLSPQIDGDYSEHDSRTTSKSILQTHRQSELGKKIRFFSGFIESRRHFERKVRQSGWKEALEKNYMKYHITPVVRHSWTWARAICHKLIVLSFWGTAAKQLSAEDNTIKETNSWVLPRDKAFISLCPACSRDCKLVIVERREHNSHHSHSFGDAVFSDTLPS